MVGSIKRLGIILGIRGFKGLRRSYCEFAVSPEVVVLVEKRKM